MKVYYKLSVEGKASNLQWRNSPEVGYIEYGEASVLPDINDLHSQAYKDVVLADKTARLSLISDLAAEYEKASPSSVKLLKLERKLVKRDHTPL